jgi:hypothetical protein
MTEATWHHVIDEHSEMAHHLDQIKRTIETPEYREPDTRVGRERYFARGGPEAWVRIVSEFRGSEDRVVTAFPQANDPRR